VMSALVRKKSKDIFLFPLLYFPVPTSITLFAVEVE
jgi:hypothetical protein